MSIKHVQFALDGVPGLNAGQRLTLVSLGEWANDDGVCWPSHDTIAKRVGVGRRQVIRIIDQLESMGAIERIERKQYSNKYRVRCDIAMSHPKSSPDVTPTAHVTSKADVTLGTPDVTSTTADVTSRASRCDIAMSPEPLRTVKEPPIEPPGRARAKKATQVPDAFEVTDELYDWAWFQLTIPKQRVDAETDKFLDHFRANGKTMKDWTAAWKNWMRRSLEFGPRNQSNGRASPGRMSAFDETQAAITEVFERINGTRSEAQHETTDDVFETTWKAS